MTLLTNCRIWGKWGSPCCLGSPRKPFLSRMHCGTRQRRLFEQHVCRLASAEPV